MKDVIKVLNQNYESFIKEEDNLLFFSGLVDYMDCVNNIPEVDKYLKELISEKNRLFDEYSLANKNSVTELLKIRKDMKIIIKTNKIKDVAIEGYDRSIQLLLDGDMWTSNSSCMSIYYDLKKICLRFDKLGKLELISKYFTKTNAGYEKTLFYHIVEKPEKLRMKIEDRANHSVWGAYTRLSILQDLFNNGDENIYKPSDDCNLSLIPCVFNSFFEKQDPVIYEYDSSNECSDVFNLSLIPCVFSFYLKEIEQIKQGNNFENANQEFKRQNYLMYVKKLHNYLIRKLSVESKEGKTINKKKRKNNELILIADLKKFNVRLKSDRNKVMRFKKNTIDDFFKYGEDMSDMLQKLGECIIPLGRKNNLIKSLSKKLELPPTEFEKIFINRDGKYGLNEEYFEFKKDL